MTFTITNIGTGTLTYTIEESVSWITSITPASGDSTGETDTITVTIDTTGLSETTHDNYFTVNSNGGNQNIQVWVTVEYPAIPTPVLGISHSTVDFGVVALDSPASKTFEIYNDGTGTLTWDIIEDVSWITSISPLAGGSDGEHRRQRGRGRGRRRHPLFPLPAVVEKAVRSRL